MDLYAKVDPTVELEQQMEENAEQEIHEDGEE
jgi:hypothetical protein